LDYQEFLESKKLVTQTYGFKVEDEELSPMLFDFQRDIARWALQKGRAAIFAGCGLGKSPMQLTWADMVCNYTFGDALILAPLAVSQQTVKEGQKFGIEANICRSQEDVKPGINITNYEILHKFDLSKFEGVVLDESSILKAYSGKIRNQIIEAFRNTPYRLACTATPAPNDIMELANHAEFLGVMTRAEMLAMWFVHDGGDTSKWRLKGHVKEAFWQWVAGWAVMLQNPIDLGYTADQFILPKLNIHPIIVPSDLPLAKTMTERRQARKASIDARVTACADLINGSDDTWLVWCGLNDESEKLTKAIDGAVEIKGSNKPDYKEKNMMAFAAGEISRLVSKPKICGYGMNFQVCHKMSFVGLSDSFEDWYQAVRREWRFGQTEEVDVYVITSEAEGAVVENIKRKEEEFNAMLSGMIAATQEICKENIQATLRDTTVYDPQVPMVLPEWLNAQKTA